MKQELLAKLPESELEIFVEEKFSSIVWEEYGKEFHYKDEMYDVAYIVDQPDGSRLLYCINDKKEKKLLDHLAKLVESGSDARKQGRSGKNVLKFQLADFIPSASELFPADPGFSKRHYSRFTAPLLTSAIEVKGPPPKAC